VLVSIDDPAMWTIQGQKRPTWHRTQPFEHSPVIGRDFDPPNGRNVAVWAVPYVEYFAFDAF
jgi:hypothetical protein